LSNEKKHRGDNHGGHGRSSPYGLSRLAPETTLVDVAEQIHEADRMLAQTTSSKLKLIARQIQHLQEQARDILEEAQRDVELHRAKCTFSRRIGHVYHLYEKPDGTLYWSMLSADEWGTPPHDYRGSYRLEPDQSWTPADEVGDDEDPLDAEELMRKLLPPA
jgi:hypothetical protein